MMKNRLSEQTIAMRAAKEFFDGCSVNLGVGIPTLCSAFIAEGRTVLFHSENGMLGYGSVISAGEPVDWDYADAGGQPVRIIPGCSFFDHAQAFDMVCGGHIDIVVLGGLQVSEKGDLANWRMGHRKTGSIGGAADLAANAKRLIIVMTHTTPKGEPKVVRKCSLPLTAKECVDLIVTDLAVIEVTKKGLLLKEIAPGFTPEDVQAVTEPALIIDPGLKEIEL